MSSSDIRSRDEAELDPLENPSPKRIKLALDEPGAEAEEIVLSEPAQDDEPTSILPPSHALLGVALREYNPDAPSQLLETDVGISEYIDRNVSKIDGIIKQRFTDFLVYEVDQDGNVIHLKSLGRPDSGSKHKTEENPPAVDAKGEAVESTSTVEHAEPPSESTELEKPTTSTKEAPWPEHFDATLAEYMPDEAVTQLKQMYLEGPEPPRVSDSGWGRRQQPEKDTFAPEPQIDDKKEEKEQKRGKGGRGRGRGRDDRGGRGGGRSGRPAGREDHRKVLSNPISSKETRTALHKIIRELFGGKLDSETDPEAVASDEDPRIVIKWGRRGGRGGRGGGRDSGGRGNYPPYIHFALQKTNRDTQDALSHLSRSLHCNVKDLTVAGTKDKRGVTVQRVALKRNGKLVEDVWKLANGIGLGRKTDEEAASQRGERGIRIADFSYRKAPLELGMLKGNAFVITLRNVQVDSVETLDKALETIKHKGFINYYGMQRFGTAAVPTHTIGLAFLRSDWQRAVALILGKRHGEHPDVAAARDAWLVDKDLDRALELLPRRVVAERCILESYKKQNGETRNAMGALSTIPRNLRLMYVHAYQSYIWNAIVSERIRTFGVDKPVPGDLVYDKAAQEEAKAEAKEEESEENDQESEHQSNRARKKAKKPWVAPKVKVLTTEDVDAYSIFDVIMPLPGKDVDYPGGKLGEMYKSFLRMDGLDPDNYDRKQRDYILGGSYRAVLHKPKELSWSVLRYTDPDVALAQADEDKLLGFDPPTVDDSGKFMALQINLQLGTAAYATMALREVTKVDTSSHHQTSLTRSSEDQKFRGGEGGGEADAKEVAGVEATEMEE